MIYRFTEFELDLAQVELRRLGEVVPIEPQVFSLLVFLIEQRERVVSKDEIIGKVWNGRVVSDSALTSRIKSARKAVGDDGDAQRLIRTVRGRGFRFVGEVDAANGGDRPSGARHESTAPAEPAASRAAVTGSPERIVTAGPAPLLLDESAAPPSIAVLPFAVLGAEETHAVIGDGLPQELITTLSRLRWLTVIARVSSFRFRGDEVDVQAVGRALGVRYCVQGSVEVRGKQIAVAFDLVDARNSSLIFSDRLRCDLGELYDARMEISASIAAALELQIAVNEARQARLRAPQSLDAWAEYHLGLQAMYRFRRRDNEVAERHFQRAVALDPGFARAYAGLSFTSFQDAFLNYRGDPATSAALARQHAERSLELDPVDPFANLTMGRSFLLAGDVDASIGWLDRSVELSPSFAQGQYSRAWALVIGGSATSGREGADRAMALSPLDPLLYAMLATRAFAHMLDDEIDVAVPWAEKAALSPGAHPLIAMIAVLAYSLAGDARRAQHWADNARTRRPDITTAHFFHAFPFTDPATRRRFEAALQRYGL